MSKYTTQVRFLCETIAGKTQSEGYNSVDAIIDSAVRHIFNFDFPIFDENYRFPLCKKILLHYYTREISEETFGLWKLRLYSKMIGIMPYYNQLYKSALIDFNPLIDTDYTFTHTGNDATDETAQQTATENAVENAKQNITKTATGTESGTEAATRTDNLQNKTEYGGTSNGTSSSQQSNNSTTGDAYSDTPQGGLSNVDNLAYLTNYRKTSVNASGQLSDTTSTSTGGADTTKSTGTQSNDLTKTVSKNQSETASQNTEKTSEINNQSNSSKNVKSTNEYIQRVTGKQGAKTYAEMIQQLRETFLNIDMMIIDDLQPLFFNLW